MLVAHPQASAADAAVIAALRDGDEVAFARLVDQHHAALRRIARLYVSSDAVADEIVQETWLAVVRGVWAFQGRSSLRTWILRILINRAKTRAQRESRTVPLADGSLAETAGASSSGASGAAFSPHLDGGHDPVNGRSSGLLDPKPSPEAAVLAREARAHLRAAIDALPANQRTVITMRDLEGYSSEDVCNVLCLTETNQRVILHRARSAVRARVAAYFREE
ncbi:MAG: sigma-70 family RNA polymerase sigma factor [Thermoanaerobaculia bacterium]